MPPDQPGTMNTAEEALLIAALEEDLDQVRQRIADMLPNERRAMLAAINLIADEIATA